MTPDRERRWRGRCETTVFSIGGMEGLLVLLALVLPPPLAVALGPTWIVVTIGGGFGALALSFVVFVLRGREGVDAFTWCVASSLIAGGFLALLASALLLALLGVSG